MQESQPRSLSSNTAVNPNVRANAVTTELQKPAMEADKDQQEQTETLKGRPTEALKETKPPPFKPYTPRIPFPQRLEQERKDKDYHQFLGHVETLKINIPLEEAMQDMPIHGKFMKEMFTNWRIVEEVPNLVMNENCSAVMISKLPEKSGDPDSITLPCQFGNNITGYALVDSGASINIMPYSFYSKLDLPKPKPIQMQIQLADKSITSPRGIVEDVLVKIDKLVFPADFVILDMVGNDEEAIILGRPFLNTAKGLVDICDSKLTLRLGTEEVTVGIDQAMKYSRINDDELFNDDDFDTLVEEEMWAIQDEEFDGNMTLGEGYFESEVELYEIEEIFGVYNSTKEAEKLTAQESRRGKREVATRPEEKEKPPDTSNDTPNQEVNDSNETYTNTSTSKERKRKRYDARKKRNRRFELGDEVLLSKPRGRSKEGKSKIRWYGPYRVKKMLQNGRLKLMRENNTSFQVNRNWVKHYDERLEDKGKDVPKGTSVKM